MWVNNLPKVATKWNSGATQHSNRSHRVGIPTALTTRPFSHTNHWAVHFSESTIGLDLGNIDNLYSHSNVYRQTDRQTRKKQYNNCRYWCNKTYSHTDWYCGYPWTVLSLEQGWTIQCEWWLCWRCVQIVQDSPFLTMDLLESCFPYALLRTSYHHVYRHAEPLWQLIT